MMEMLSNVSSLTSRALSIAAISFFLSDLICQNHAAKYWLSSGLSSSSAINPVNSSISTTPKLKTSAFVVIFPVTAYSGAKYPKVPASLVTTDFSPSGASFTKPKSETFALKSSASKIFDGLRSL
ncbi:hypothetical protein V8G54_019912 [Vigna mungo]|uniref:Uncharacterized protein n=1 Tax=Vigna mungo TaxID=3915 RepID=A0AAQ3NBM7_VIGMU